MAGGSLPSLELEELAQKLSAGFEALLEEVKDLAQKEATLRKSLEAGEAKCQSAFRLSTHFSMTRNQN